MKKPVSSMNHMERKRAYEWVGKHFTVISNKQVYSYSDIIVFLEKIMKQQEVDAVFVDPYNSLKLDMANSSIGVHDYHYEAASEFLTFSTANNVAVWLNMHAVTEARSGSRVQTGYLLLLTQRTQRVVVNSLIERTCFITIHRKVQHPDFAQRKVTEVHIRKVRDVETGGEPTRLLTALFASKWTHREHRFRRSKNSENLFQSC